MIASILAFWRLVPWQVKLAVAAFVVGVFLLQRFGARKAAEALAKHAAAYAEDKAKRTEAGRKAAANEMRETRDAKPEDLVARIRERDAKWD